VKLGFHLVAARRWTRWTPGFTWLQQGERRGSFGSGGSGPGGLRCWRYHRGWSPISYFLVRWALIATAKLPEMRGISRAARRPLWNARL